MKVEYQFILMVIATILIIIFGFPASEAGYVTPPIPATWIGFIGIVTWLLMVVGTEWLRAASPQIITNDGKWSVNHKDIHLIPITKIIDGIEKIIDYYVMIFTGGIDRSSISTHGPPHYPMVACRSMCLQKLGNNYSTDANLTLTEDKKLSPILRAKKCLFPNRFKSPNFTGMTAHSDGSGTQANLNLEDDIKRLNVTIDEQNNLIKGLYNRLRQEEQTKKPKFLSAIEAKKIESLNLED